MPYTTSLRDDNYTEWARAIVTSWVVAQRFDSKSNWQSIRDRLDGIRIALIYCTDMIHSNESEKTFELISDDITLLIEIVWDYQRKANKE